jgi:hypothetical protein
VTRAPVLLALLAALAACAAPPPPAPPPADAAREVPRTSGFPRSAAPEERPPTADQVARRCLEYGYVQGTPEWAECERLEEREFLMRPKRFVWPGQPS